MIAILRAGPLSSVQDQGRRGVRHLGVSSGGALDPDSLALANRLVGNAADLAGLEISIALMQLRFERDCRFALTGASVNAALDGRPIACWWSCVARAGQVLTIAPAEAHGGLGMHAYLAVDGGIDVEPVLGSRGTDLKAGFGGLQGRLLRNGDRLPLGPAAPRLELAAFGIRAPDWLVPIRGPLPIRALEGPDAGGFTMVSRREFWGNDWEVTLRSNRMGYRLAGPRLVRGKRSMHDLYSHGVLPGVVQVPPVGQPIVLMADAQTTGGYPKIAVVISADLPRMAQLHPNAKLRFLPCTLDDARAALREHRQRIARIESLIGERIGGD